MSGGIELSSLIEEAQRLLASVGEVLTSTMQQGVELAKDYEELASNKIADVTKAKKKELADLSAYGEGVRSCVEKKRVDFRKVEDKLIKELAGCYAKHYGSLDKVTAKKAAIREEAQQIKDELEREMLTCMSAANKTECLAGALNSLKKRLKSVSSRVGEAVEKEALARVKASKAVYECDKKATDEAYKKCTAIVNEVERCAGKQGLN